jgi:hypothetical protein
MQPPFLHRRRDEAPAAHGRRLQMYSARVLALVQRITRRWCSAPAVRDFVRTHLQPATIDDDVGTLLLKFVIGVAYTLAVSTARVPRAVGLWIPAATLQLFVSDKQLFAVHDEAAAAAPQCLMPYVAAVLYAYGTTSSFAALVAPLLALEHTPVEQALAQYRQVLREMPDVSAAERAVRTRLQREPVASLWRCGAASASPEDMYTYMFANAFLRPAAAADRAYTAGAGQDSVVQLVSAYTAADSLETKRNIFAAIVAQSIQLVLQGPVARSVAAPNEFLELVRVYAGGRTDQDRAAAFLKLVAAAISETGPHAHVGSVADAVETYAKEQTPATFAGIVASAVVQLSSQQAATDRVRVVLQAVANSGTAGSAAGVATSLLALLPPPGAATAASFGTGERDAKTGASPQVVAEGLYSGGGVGGSFAHDLSEVFSDVDKATLQQLETAVESSPAVVADSTKLSKPASPPTAPPKPAEIARTPTVSAAPIAAPTASTTVEQFKDVESLNVTYFSSQEEKEETIRRLTSVKARSADVNTQVKIQGLLKQANAAPVEGVAAVAALDSVFKPVAKSKETPETKFRKLLEIGGTLKEIEDVIPTVTFTADMIREMEELLMLRSDKKEIAEKIEAQGKITDGLRPGIVGALRQFKQDRSTPIFRELQKLKQKIESIKVVDDAERVKIMPQADTLKDFNPSENLKSQCREVLTQIKNQFDTQLEDNQYKDLVEQFKNWEPFKDYIDVLQSKCECKVFESNWFMDFDQVREIERQKKTEEAAIKLADQQKADEELKKLEELRNTDYKQFFRALIESIAKEKPGDPNGDFWIGKKGKITNILHMIASMTKPDKDEDSLKQDLNEIFTQIDSSVRSEWKGRLKTTIKNLLFPVAKLTNPPSIKPPEQLRTLTDRNEQLAILRKAGSRAKDPRTFKEQIQDAITDQPVAEILQKLQEIKKKMRGKPERIKEKEYGKLQQNVDKMAAHADEKTKPIFSEVKDLLNTMTERFSLGAVSRKHISGLARAFDAARGAGHASHRRFNAAFAKELTRELGAATARRLLAELARLGKSRTGKTPRGLMLDK